MSKGTVLIVSVPDYGELILNFSARKLLLLHSTRSFRPRLRGTNLKQSEKADNAQTAEIKVSVPDYGELILNLAKALRLTDDRIMFPSPITGN